MKNSLIVILLIIVSFTDTGSLTYDGSANSCGGQFSLPNKNHITIKSLACTDRGGAGSNWDERISTALSTSKCYVIDERELRIYFEYEEEEKNLINLEKNKP